MMKEKCEKREAVEREIEEKKKTLIDKDSQNNYQNIKRAHVYTVHKLKLEE